MTIRRIFILLAFTAGHTAMALEEPEYEVLSETASYEIRRYEPYIIAEVDVGDRSADSQGFRTLAGYIFGDNAADAKMQMTAPVESRAAENRNQQTYAFVMEKKYTLDTLPAPNDERIRIREKPARVVAALRFSGRWTEKNVARHKRQLLADLETDRLAPLGGMELARYNSPFTPWFLRRNELIVPIDWPAKSE